MAVYKVVRYREFPKAFCHRQTSGAAADH